MLEDLKKEKENASNSAERSISVQRIQPSRTTAQHQRPSAFVRPAFHYQQMQNVAASPVKVYDTLM
ncbi:hypothetical protein OESDEN_23308 [Oesophagostomum dentatum]|uniref:Uncharacterized protein n=1 Tax=Oesophagostomum dentatum TaxID=61180 RepID=A0A0B1S0T2_OESDE|nr:hypothetical protein OESDEN_23308 [Oesophagostomum dentatum]